MPQLPTKEECFDLIEKMDMMPHILDHSLQVCRVALLVADQIGSRNGCLNRELILVSALLHDITKTRAIKTGESHADTGGRLLRDMGYNEVGEIIEQHVFLPDIPETVPIMESEIVNYADKRVLHDRIVPLNERMDYILERYGTNACRRERLIQVCRQADQLEQRIFNQLPIEPDDIAELVAATRFDLTSFK